MALSKAQLSTILNEDGLEPTANKEWRRLKILSKQINGDLVNVWAPKDADQEYQDLMSNARSPLLHFAAQVTAQGMHVTGYTNDVVWEQAWKRNNWHSKQSFTNYETVALGYSYIGIFPSDKKGVVMVPLSALKTYAHYSDPFDTYPEYVIHRLSDTQLQVIDKTHVYQVTTKSKPGPTINTDYTAGANAVVTEKVSIEKVDSYSHGLDYVPVARVSNTITPTSLDVPQSSVELALPNYRRCVMATFTVLMLLRYGAFPQKWATGGQFVDSDGNPTVRPSVDSIIHSPDDLTRFGNFTAADVTQAKETQRYFIEELASLVHVPAQYIAGSVVNTSAEGIQAAEHGYDRNLSHRKEAIADGYLLALRIAEEMLFNEAKSAGVLPEDAEFIVDYNARLTWEDVGSRSLAQVADAIAKLAGVGAPVSQLFRFIPGWTDEEASSAADYARATSSAENSTAITEAIKIKAETIKLLTDSGISKEDAQQIVNLYIAEPQTNSDSTIESE